MLYCVECGTDVPPTVATVLLDTPLNEVEGVGYDSRTLIHVLDYDLREPKPSRMMNAR